MDSEAELLIKRWWAEVLSNQRLPLSDTLRNNEFYARGRHDGYKDWPMLVRRTALLDDFLAWSKYRDFPVEQFHMMVAPWIYVYGKINQTSRLTAREQVHHGTRWVKTRQQRYFIRVPLPLVCATAFEHLEPNFKLLDFRWPKPRRSYESVINDIRMRDICVIGTRTKWRDMPQMAKE
jgi:hypothetical protein